MKIGISVCWSQFLIGLHWDCPWSDVHIKFGDYYFTVWGCFGPFSLKLQFGKDKIDNLGL